MVILARLGDGETHGGPWDHPSRCQAAGKELAPWP